MDFAASAITYRVRVWTTDFAADERIRDRVRSRIYYAFRRDGISIPYPIQVQVVETNIRHTSDRCLLGDGVRVLMRAMMKVTAIAGPLGATLRDRSRSVKYRVWRLLEPRRAGAPPAPRQTDPRVSANDGRGAAATC